MDAVSSGLGSDNAQSSTKEPMSAGNIKNISGLFRGCNIHHGRHVPSQCPKLRKSPPWEY